MAGARWFGVRDGDARASALYERHYSYCRSARAERRGEKRICGPGEHMVLMTVDCQALLVWRKMNRSDLAGQSGVCCSIFHNAGEHLSSELIGEAEELAWGRWPGERLYTYVDPGRVRSCNPGYCFKVAGWSVCGETKKGLVILEKMGSVGKNLKKLGEVNLLR